MAIGDLIGTASIGIVPDMSPWQKAGAAFAVVGAAAGAAIAAGIAEAMDQANITSTLQAQLGTTDAVAAQQGKAAGKLFADGVSGTFQEAADSIKATVQSGLAPPGTTTKQLSQIATKAQDIVTVFGQDMPAVTNAAAQAVRTGLAKNSSEAFDIITKGFQSGANKADDFLDTINEYGTQFRKAGIDGQQATGLINQGLQAGARDADIVADAVKEFSIRAIDGSDLSAQGFKALGLNADDMATKFAKGGKLANGVLDVTLDKLRNVKDPVKQSQIATELFGTQAEDLGKALFKLDPSAAVKSLGSVGGAADKLGKTLRSGPAYELQTFQRRLKQTFVETLGTEVLPIVVSFGTWFNKYLSPPLAWLARVLGETLGTAIRGTIAAITAVVNWFKMMATWLIPLGILIAGVTLSMTLNAIAAGAQAAAILAVTVAMRIARGITVAMTAAQWLWNAALNANPMVLVVTLILALAAAIVVAYHRSETFRSIVQATWAAIQTGAKVAWETVIKPALAGIVTAFKAVGDAAVWLWTSVLKPVFTFIWEAAKVLATIFIIVVFGPIILMFKAVAATATWLWKSILAPVFAGIGKLVSWLWTNIVRPNMNMVIGIFKTLAAVAGWLWRVIIGPVFRAIGSVFSAWWASAKATFSAAVNFVKSVLGVAFRAFYTYTIKPVWDAVRKAISAAWAGIRSSFDALKRGVGAVRDSFSSGVKAIGKVWTTLKSIAKGPVQFVIDTVYNNGLRKVWNTVAGFTGAKKLGAVKFAGGGRTQGGTPGVDSIPILAMADEFMVKRSSARQVGYGNLEYINRTGRLPGYKDGGIISGVTDWLSSGAKKVGNWVGGAADLITNPGKMWDKAVSGIKNKIASIGGGDYGRMVAGIPTKMISSLKDKLIDSVGSLGSSVGLGGDSGGSGVQRWTGVVQQALKMVGQPAAYTGITLRRMNQESGGNPNIVNKWDSNWLAGYPSVGLMQVIRPTYQSNAGPFKNTGPFSYGVSTNPLANVYASMRYALGAYGSLPAAYNRAGGYDSGGWLPPGLSMAYNGTGASENKAVFTKSQWATLQGLTAGGHGGGLSITIENHGVIGSKQEALDFLTDALETLRRTGRLKRILAGS